MATAIVTDRTDGMYVDPHLGVFGGVVAVAEATETAGTVFARTGMRLTILPITGADDTLTVTTGIEDIHAVAWQTNNPDNDGHVAVTLTVQATGIVTFDQEGSDAEEGWLWILHGGPSAAPA